MPDPHGSGRAPGSVERILLEACVQLGVAALGIWMTATMIARISDPSAGKHRQMQKALCKRLGISPGQLKLSSYELALAPRLVTPTETRECLDDVAGLQHVHEQLKTDIDVSRIIDGSFRYQLITPSKGILLYGPPGTGKTTIAKAFAKSLDAVLLNVTASAIYSKWLGDSNKMISAVFSLACKLSHIKKRTLVFIDEVDSILGETSGTSSEHSSQVPAPDESTRVEILRKKIERMGVELSHLLKFDEPDAVISSWLTPSTATSCAEGMGMPNIDQLQSVCMLGKEDIESCLLSRMHPLQRLAHLTQGFSGSDIVEVCKRFGYRYILHYNSSDRDSALHVNEAMLLRSLCEVKVASNTIQAPPDETNHTVESDALAAAFLKHLFAKQWNADGSDLK